MGLLCYGQLRKGPALKRSASSEQRAAGEMQSCVMRKQWGGTRWHSHSITGNCSIAGGSKSSKLGQQWNRTCSVFTVRQSLDTWLSQASAQVESQDRLPLPCERHFELSVLPPSCLKDSPWHTMYICGLISHPCSWAPGKDLTLAITLCPPSQVHQHNIHKGLLVAAFYLSSLILHYASTHFGSVHEARERKGHGSLGGAKGGVSFEQVKLNKTSFCESQLAGNTWFWVSVVSCPHGASRVAICSSTGWGYSNV